MGNIQQGELDMHSEEYPTAHVFSLNGIIFSAMHIWIYTAKAYNASLTMLYDQIALIFRCLLDFGLKILI